MYRPKTLEMSSSATEEKKRKHKTLLRLGNLRQRHSGYTSVPLLFNAGARRAMSRSSGACNLKRSKYGTRNRHGNLSVYSLLCAADVFHKECLNDWASRMAPNTAPAGYKCPVCSSPVFPAPNLVSPVADRLREMISIYPWAQTGLGLPLIKETQNEGAYHQDWSVVNGSVTSESENQDSVIVDPSLLASTKPKAETFRPQTQIHSQGLSSNTSTVSGSSNSSVRVTSMEDPLVTPSQYRGEGHHNNLSSVRKGSSSETRLLFNTDGDADDEENKYKRRSAIEWFSRWWRTMSRPSSRHHQRLLGGSRRMVMILVLLAGATLLVILSYFSHGASDDDPLLDPFNNPNIRIEAE
nr:zinc finger protein-like 1 [Penaeus vannamei]